MNPPFHVILLPPPSSSISLASTYTNHHFLGSRKIFPHKFPPSQQSCWSPVLYVPVRILYIGDVVIYRVMVVWLCIMYSSTVPSFASSIFSPMGGYTQLPPGYFQVLLSIFCNVTQLWKHPSARQRRGITFRIYDPKKITDWMTTLKNVPDILVSPSSRSRIYYIRSHFLITSLILYTTSGKSLSMDEIRQQRYSWKQIMANYFTWIR